MAGERGIYSLLDMHQDAFSRKYCGNGVPDWAAAPDKENFPYPLEVGPCLVTGSGGRRELGPRAGGVRGGRGGPPQQGGLRLHQLAKLPLLTQVTITSPQLHI